jgi:hypothetical protein
MEMHLTGLDLLFWAATFVAHIVLLIVLWVRRRASTFPLFTTLITMDVVRTIMLFFIQRYGTHADYFYTYWSLAILDVALQLAVVYEMASIVFRPQSKWARDVIGGLIWWIIGSFAVATALAWLASPPTSLWLQTVMIKGNVFSAALMSQFFVGMIALSATAGLPWHTHVARISQGLGVYSVFTVALEAGRTYFGLRTNSHTYDGLSHVRIGVYMVCVTYWIIMLWRDAPPSRAMTERMRRQLAAISAGATLDLQRLRSRREP